MIYYEGAKKMFYVKRFTVDQPVKEELIISDHPDSYLELVSTYWRPVVALAFAKERGKDARPEEIVVLDEFIGVKGIKAMGNMLTKFDLKSTELKEPLPYEDVEEADLEEVLTEGENSAETNQNIELPAQNDDKDTPEFGEQITLF